MFGVRPSLALNTSVHSARPDNLLRVIMGGAGTYGSARPGAMPGFRASFNDRQLAQLLFYLRARFAADQPAWTGIEAVAARIRANRERF
jgi:nicotinate dehydrogenase subunit B